VLTQEAPTTQRKPTEGLTPAPAAQVGHLREPRSYRLKNRLLGPPLDSDQLQHERLGKPTALAVFASDNLSSSAYATEEILRVLIPVFGFAAFTLVTPITIALLVVLGFLILSYRQTIKAYPSAGGAYIVTRDNFGIMPAQVAGVALLTDYILTVSVSVAAGSDALASAISSLAPYKLWIAIGFVCIIAFGNLRGVKESGKVFAVPTYFFMLNMLALLLVGGFKLVFGHLTQGPTTAPGMLLFGSKSAGAWMTFALLKVVLKAFGSGGAAVTGVEAISNGVPAFKEPAWKNARSTLVIMGGALGVMFLGLSIMAAKVHAVPYEGGTPTVISQVGQYVFGGGIGKILFYSLQAGTMLILVLAANTSFADFPRLASFHAGDNFMPRQFQVRGHRLVFSNGIIFLAVAGIVALLGTDGQVSRLIPLYAIGVFTSFTMSQAGMAKHHITHKEEGWKNGLFINATGALLSFVVLIIVAAVKFTEGAWVIMLLVPIMVVGLVRLNKAYEAEHEELMDDVQGAAEAKVMHRHAVVVLVDSLDAAAARAMQYARTLAPDDLRAVHFDLDPWKTKDLTEAWGKLGFSTFPLDIIECPDRRMARATLETVAHIAADGRTEVSVLIPRREYTKVWHRILHDRSSSTIAGALAEIPHCTVTIVPYHLGSGRSSDATPAVAAPAPEMVATLGAVGSSLPGSNTVVPGLPNDRVRLGDLKARERSRVAGRVRSMRVQPWGGAPSLEVVLVDGTGSLTAVFLGRREIGGIRPGSLISLEGTTGRHNGTIAMLNPQFDLISVPHMPDAPGEH
jgi:amino acid transporter